LADAGQAGQHGFDFLELDSVAHMFDLVVLAGDETEQAIGRIQALPVAPDFLIHTGDLTHLSKPEEFDTLQQVLVGAKVGQVFYVPGEHDMLADNGRQYIDRYGKQQATKIGGQMADGRQAAWNGSPLGDVIGGADAGTFGGAVDVDKPDARAHSL
jgi:3',5'-cyclic AMP phosphodiesterase CpdA